MQIKYIVAALAAAIPLVASAADTAVQLYGIVDLAMAREDVDVPGVSSVTKMHAGREASRFGFRGTEDLGNGLTAMFNVEGGFDASTGVGDTALFGRRAVVGLQGAFGEVTLGREYTPLDTVSSATTTMGQGFYGSNLNAFAQGGMTRRISNSVNYKSVAASGFRFSGAVGLGENPIVGGPSNNYIGAGAEYKNGPLMVGAGFGQTERAAGEDKEYIVGAAYKIGIAELKANYMRHNRASDNNTFTQINAGVGFTSGAGTVFVSVQESDFDRAGKGTGVAVAYQYNLSKRTFVYASFGYLSNDERSNFALTSTGSAVTPPVTALGADPRALAIGMRHAF